MNETRKAVLRRIWSAVLSRGRTTARALALYLDDLLLIAGGICFTAAALDLGGRPAALLTGGVCLVAYAVIIARARKGGGK